jgi:hypothetical protein
LRREPCPISGKKDQSRRKEEGKKRKREAHLVQRLSKTDSDTNVMGVFWSAAEGPVALPEKGRRASQFQGKKRSIR